LLIQTSGGLILLKANYETWEVSFISRYNLAIERIRDIIVDKLNPFKVLIRESNRFLIGKLIGDEIVFSPHQEFNLGHFYYAMLAGNQLCGLRFMSCNQNSWIWQYHKIDLTALTEESIDAPLAFNKSFRCYGFMVSMYLFF
jgi:hypothetical protein